MTFEGDGLCDLGVGVIFCDVFCFCL